MRKKLFSGNMGFRFRSEGLGVRVFVYDQETDQDLVDFPITDEANIRAFIADLAGTAGLPAPWGGR